MGCQFLLQGCLTSDEPGFQPQTVPQPSEPGQVLQHCYTTRIRDDDSNNLSILQASDEESVKGHIGAQSWHSGSLQEVPEASCLIFMEAEKQSRKSKAVWCSQEACQ